MHVFFRAPGFLLVHYFILSVLLESSGLPGVAVFPHSRDRDIVVVHHARKVTGREGGIDDLASLSDYVAGAA